MYITVFILFCTAGPKLTETGQHNVAAQVYLAADLVKESIDSFINGDDWVRARKVAAELDPRYLSCNDNFEYVET